MQYHLKSAKVVSHFLPWNFPGLVCTFYKCQRELKLQPSNIFHFPNALFGVQLKILENSDTVVSHG